MKKNKKVKRIAIVICSSLIVALCIFVLVNPIRSARAHLFLGGYFNYAIEGEFKENLSKSQVNDKNIDIYIDNKLIGGIAVQKSTSGLWFENANGTYFK